MKKILSGFIYRALRSIETWIMVCFLVFASLYICYIRIDNPDNGISHDAGGRFESLGVSAKEAYMFDAAALPEDVYYKLDSEDDEVWYEIKLLFGTSDSIQFIMTAVLIIYLPVFLGRMFSDGTVKNLIAGGHSKGRIYLSSLLFSIVLDMAMMITCTFLYVIMCLILKWHPPVYIPVVLMMFLISLLISVTVTSVCTAFLFISGKRTVAFIAGFILMLLIWFISASVPAALLVGTQNIDVSGENIKLIKEIKKEDPYNLEMSFVLSEFNYRFIYHDEEIVFFEDSILPRPVKTAALALTYADPAVIHHTNESLNIPYYVMYRDGLMAVNAASDIFWIILTSFCGIIIFRRKEIRC